MHNFYKGSRLVDIKVINHENTYARFLSKFENLDNRFPDGINYKEAIKLESEEEYYDEKIFFTLLFTFHDGKYALRPIRSHELALGGDSLNGTEPLSTFGHFIRLVEVPPEAKKSRFA